MIIVIGIDPGIHTGWAVCRDGKIVESGVQVFELSRGESPGMRFLRFRKWLTTDVLMWDGVGGKWQPTSGSVIVAYERAHHRGGAATEIGVGFCTRIQEIAAEVGAQTLPVHSATLKKWATGHGQASKWDMVKEASGRTGWKDSDGLLTHDEADAILVALWAWEQVR